MRYLDNILYVRCKEMLISFYLVYLLKTQLRLEAFYSFNERFAKIRSKRIKKAVKGITGNQYSDMMDDPVEEVSKSRTGNISGKSGDNEPQTHAKRTARTAPGNKSSFLEKSKPKRSRKRTAEQPVFPEVENTEATVRQCSDRGFLRNGKGRGRGRGRGRGKANLCFEQSDSSSCDVDSGHDEHEVHVDESRGPHELRKVRLIFICLLPLWHNEVYIMSH